MAEIVLYGSRRIPFVEKVARAIEYKGLPFEVVEPRSQEDFRRFNPETGLLPAATIRGEFVHDSTAILHALDAAYPERPLLAADPRVASQQRQLEDWSDECFLWYYAVWNAMKKTAEDGHRPRTARNWLRWLAGLLDAGDETPRPRPFRMSQQQLLREIAGRLDDLINLLGDRRFFYADTPSMADFAIYAMVHSMQRDDIPGTAELVTSRPALVEHAARVEAAAARSAAPAA